MDSQTSGLANHGAFTYLKEISEGLASTKEQAASAPESLAEWNRIERVIESIQGRLDTADPALIPPSALGNLEGVLRDLLNQLTQFKSTTNLAHLQSANTQASTALTHAAPIPGVSSPKVAKSLLASMNDYHEAVTKLIQELQARVAGADGEVETIKKALTALEGRIDAQQSRNEAQLTALVDTFNTNQTAQESTFNANQSAQESAFKTAESARDVLVDEFLRVRGEGAQEWLKAASEKAESERLEQSANAIAVLGTLEKLKEQASELVGLTGRISKANTYQEAAKKEARRGLWWSMVAAGSLAFLSGIAIYTLWSYDHAPHPGPIDWSGFSIRLYTLLSLTGLALYAGRQGEIHRNAERQNRRLYSDLASVSPFLADLAPADREQVIKAVAERVFGHPEPLTEPMKQSYTLTPEQVSKLADFALEVGSKLAKKP